MVVVDIWFYTLFFLFTFGHLQNPCSGQLLLEVASLKGLEAEKLGNH